MSKSERILKTYQKLTGNKECTIKVHDLFFYDIIDKDGEILKSGDLAKGTRGLGGMKSIS